MPSNSSRHDIVIAGSGIAAAATAIRLLAFGFSPVLLRSQKQPYRAAEALPQTALRLFHSLELDGVLQQAGAIPVEGFENKWSEAAPILKSQWFLHVERTELARTMLAEAAKRGAAIVSVETPPALQISSQARNIGMTGNRSRYLAAVDATGRSACWSRPVQRAGGQVADMFRVVPNRDGPLCAGIVRLAELWAYRIDLPSNITVGTVKQKDRLSRVIEDDVVNGLNLPAGEVRYLGRRPAFPQWSTEPVKACRIAVGDAAMAHDPIAGQGICFALASALAAAAVIRTWRDTPENVSLADDYFRDFVQTEKRRHFAARASLYENEKEPMSDESVFPEAGIQGRQKDFEETSLEQQWATRSRIRFSGKLRNVGVQADGLIVPAQVITLNNGNSVRWLADFDLLSLTKYEAEPAPIIEVLAYLGQQGVSPAKARQLVSWSMNHGVLAEIADD